MTATLTVGHLNVHNYPKATRAVLRHRPDTVGLAEAHRLLPFLARFTGYRMVVDPTRQGGGRGTSQETPILTRKRLASLGRLTLQVSEDTHPSRVGPARWMTVHLFAHPVGRVAHFNLHPNAAVVGHGLQVPRVREYAESIASLDRALIWARREGFHRVLTADLNYREAEVDPWSPYRVLQRHGLAVHHHGPVDVVAADQHLALTHARLLPAADTGTDHPGAVVTLTPA